MKCSETFTIRIDGETHERTCNGDAQRTWHGQPVCDSCFVELLDQAREFGENR